MQDYSEGLPPINELEPRAGLRSIDLLVTMKPRIRSVNLSKYARVANELGIDPLSMFRKVGLDHSCLNTPDLLVPESAFATLLETSSAQMGHASLGLLMGSYWRLSDFGPISLLLQHQESLAAMLKTLKDYNHLISSTVATEVVTQGRYSIIQLHLDTERETPCSLCCRMAATALPMWLGRWALRRARYSGILRRITPAFRKPWTPCAVRLHCGRCKIRSCRSARRPR